MSSIEKKLAIFKTAAGSEIECGDWAEDHKGYARLTEYVTIQFPALSQEAAVENQLKALSDMEAELRNRFQHEMDGIESERGKLLSLTHVEA